MYGAKWSRRAALAGVLLAAGLLAGGCGSSRVGFTQTGQGSYYADKFNGRPTASGAIYRPGKMTAAHNTLPFGTRIRVTNVRNGRSVKVTVNDRGPHVAGRIVDVSGKAANQLDLKRAGVVPVRLEVIGAAPRAARR
ncbi:septal ring lytic transglycosylase RlpA family protein [Hymenobacter caeli]|uniref:Probable endolytic peptidoglycan transglycosylase RlpA n=1 Tax=Hymenobacter caeli TaxID=2735894 RepID=A0ABX2FNT3_9BACT|nr:septal ring lytic transglycosylase RlpA family protein [Hymenobacter caeli]NRT18803.1 rare lipoprotein A [Hymenobacter caeli]